MDVDWELEVDDRPRWRRFENVELALDLVSLTAGSGAGVEASLEEPVGGVYVRLTDTHPKRGGKVEAALLAVVRGEGEGSDEKTVGSEGSMDPAGAAGSTVDLAGETDDGGKTK